MRAGGGEMSDATKGKVVFSEVVVGGGGDNILADGDDRVEDEAEAAEASAEGVD